MAIDIIGPPAGGQFGPGFRITLETDVIGPLPIDTAWQAWIHPVGDEDDRRYVDGLFQPTHSVNWDWLAQPDLPGPLQNVSAPVLDGTTVRLLVERREGGTLVESVSQDVVWNMRDGIPLWQERRRANEPSSGGLTEEQAAQLELASIASVQQMGVPGDLEQIPIASILTHPTFAQLRVFPGGTPAAGDGIIDLDAAPPFSVYGLWWEFTFVPPELGVINGPTERYRTRMLQLRTIHTLDGVDFVTEVLDADFQRVIWLWEHALPTRVEYSILPGVEVSFHTIEWSGLA